VCFVIVLDMEKARGFRRGLYSLRMIFLKGIIAVAIRFSGKCIMK